MNEYEKFYRESLYPFQDGILGIVRHIDAPFYLTGGIALSRNHRLKNRLPFLGRMFIKTYHGSVLLLSKGSA